ncbi:DoxX family protein [Tolypothrix sp. NIES-4075]|uniref:DoxX family protein n=1 Tax=Tolypothrix sp. NIES-4075 TaxID=2005459 RepID=UPI000B5C4EDB|nr:DoxX family protein [Tolypothrix sp. NIES-4075]GAX44101.1 DoxX family protein [Tolypothrix sp. NIES-4075]
MIYKYAIAFAISFLVASFNLPRLGLNLVSSLNTSYPDGLPGLVLLLLRVSVGWLFILHGYPKITHLRQWAESLKMPIFMCFLSAASMLGGGICLIIGFLTLLATLPIFCSMVFAAYLDISGGKPIVAKDPYQIPEEQYKGPDGKGEPPSWEKAFMYCIMLIAIAVLGPGAYSLDALMFGR